MTALALKGVDRARLLRLADGLAVAVAVSLPWSTTATGILVVLWLIAVLPTLDGETFRAQALGAAGGLPLLLFALAAAGMLWSDVPLAQRFAGLGSFAKLLLIPLLLAHFRQSGRGSWVLAGFLISSVVLLIAAFISILTPGKNLWGLANSYGVPVKDYIAQSHVFVTSAFGALFLAAHALRPRRYVPASLLALLAIGFLAHMAFVTASRTALLTVPLLLVLLAFTQFGWRGRAAIVGAGMILLAAAWVSSSYVRERVSGLHTEIDRYRSENALTSAGARFDYWTKSVGFIAQAPIFGHGTGTIRSLFERAAAEPGGAAWQATSNPHNQTLAVGIQLGFAGMAVLVAMWVVHLALFRGVGLAAYVGLIIVVQNIVGSARAIERSPMRNAAAPGPA
jgi:O-antigen ligase